MVGNDYKLIRKKLKKEVCFRSEEEEGEEERRSGEEQATEEKNRAKRERDELNKRLNNTHQGLINCCSMGATS